MPHLPYSTSRTGFLAFLIKTYALLVLLGGWLSCAFLLAIRIIWGWQFFQTGKGKLTHLGDVTEFFQSLHIPMPHFNAILAACTECFGGLMLLVGLGGRLASVPLTITMVVAYLTAERPDIHSMDDFVKATPFPFLFTALTVLCFGPGKLSLDAIIAWALKRERVIGFDVINSKNK